MNSSRLDARTAPWGWRQRACSSPTGYSSQDSLKVTAENQSMGLIIAQCTS